MKIVRRFFFGREPIDVMEFYELLEYIEPIVSFLVVPNSETDVIVDRVDIQRCEFVKHVTCRVDREIFIILGQINKLVETSVGGAWNVMSSVIVSSMGVSASPTVACTAPLISRIVVTVSVGITMRVPI